jgi:hypothetical protein
MEDLGLGLLLHSRLAVRANEDPDGEYCSRWNITMLKAACAVFVLGSWWLRPSSPWSACCALLTRTRDACRMDWADVSGRGTAEPQRRVTSLGRHAALAGVQQEKSRRWKLAVNVIQFGFKPPHPPQRVAQHAALLTAFPIFGRNSSPDLSTN